MTLDEELAAIFRYASAEPELGHCRYLECKAEIQKLRDQIDAAATKLDDMRPRHSSSSPVGVGSSRMIGKKVLTD